MLLDAERKYWQASKSWFFLAIHLIFLSNLFPLDSLKALFLIPYLAFIYLYEIDLKTIAIASLLSIPLIFLQSLPYLKIDTTYFSYLNKIFNANQYISNILDYLYEDKISQLIKTLVFNVKVKTDTTRFFYKAGIIHLITISGFHLSGLNYCLSKIIKSKPILILLLAIYWSFLGYSIASLRAILAIIFRTKNKYKSWALSALIAPLFNVSIYKTIPFWLSWFLPLLFHLNSNLCRNKFSLYLLNSISALIYSSLILLPFRKNINILTPLYLIIFEPIIIVMFIYFFISWPLVFLTPAHNLIIKFLDYVCNNLNLLDSNLKLTFWDNSYTLIGLLIFSLIFITQQHKCLNFTTPKIKAY